MISVNTFTFNLISDYFPYNRFLDLQQVDFTKVNSESLEEFLKNGIVLCTALLVTPVSAAEVAPAEETITINKTNHFLN